MEGVFFFFWWGTQNDIFLQNTNDFSSCNALSSIFCSQTWKKSHMDVTASPMHPSKQWSNLSILYSYKASILL